MRRSNNFTRKLNVYIWILQMKIYVHYTQLLEHNFITKELFTLNVKEVTIQPFRSLKRKKISKPYTINDEA
jgi:hypothetical protein